MKLSLSLTNWIKGYLEITQKPILKERAKLRKQIEEANKNDKENISKLEEQIKI